ncbi:MAG: hypothetical protein ISS94_01460 [Candidatus Syntrophoarchaeum sp.]|nr:hypothetical protein [Methanomicrobia archaeon]MBL7117440.1 hypothetical protein [Candidatus Syntrophoarchaeum sp.]
MNGNGNKMVLMTIAAVAVGIFALPSTVSLFTGQHNWYSIGGGANELPCIKCHADVYEEFLRTDAHSTLDNSSNGRPSEACYKCHRTNKSITYARGNVSGGTWQIGEEAHAASTVACMLCHQDNNSAWTDVDTPFAGGFGNMSYKSPFNYTNPDVTDAGTAAAHDEFIKGAINNSLMEDANEACIACHTHIPVKINWKHAYNIEFNATYNESIVFPPTHFNTSDYKANGTAPNIESYGNHSGGANVSHWPTTGNVTYWG